MMFNFYGEKFMCDIVYILSPAHVATGGPELLHQLCAELRNIGINAMMFYFNHKNKDVCPQPDIYKKYNVPYTIEIYDNDNNAYIFPETAIDALTFVKKGKKYLWWLSVDMPYDRFIDIYSKANNQNEKRQKLIYIIKMHSGVFQDGVIHLVQSEYARNHCQYLGISDDKIKYLGDYLRDEFIENALKTCEIEKQNMVAYNPKKGMEFTKKLISLAPDIEWIPLQGLTPDEMSLLLRSVKVYIDFGEHPGMDRIPREAAISGCCVITGRKGAAAYHEDVPILEKYKFDDNAENVHYEVIAKIRDIFDNYEQYTLDFDEYREFIKNQKNKFKLDVRKIFG